MTTRVLVFEDSVYHQADGELSTDRAFLLYVSGLAEHDLQLRLLGRLHPEAGRSHYRLPPSVEFVGLPHYPSLVDPAAAFGLLRALRRGWQALDGADVAWLMGPHPLALLLAVMARLRRVPVVLGVRQDLPRYVRERHPQRWRAHLVADALEHLWRRLAARTAVVAVGPELSRHYGLASQLLPLDICLVPARDLHRSPPRRDYDQELTLLSVGRLEQEKNPLLLADVLAQLRQRDPRWRLVVCGEGSLAEALQERLCLLGVVEHAEVRGYVPVDRGLLELYRECSVFLHVSWTEGLPQVLTEAWATDLPVVATAVGGVTEAAGAAALLVPPGDATAAVDAVERLALDACLRRRLSAEGRRRLETSGREHGLARLADFLTVAAAQGTR
jgi:glycosyltransferase involved in cell wall biosynthesis